MSCFFKPSEGNKTEKLLTNVVAKCFISVPIAAAERQSVCFKIVCRFLLVQCGQHQNILYPLSDRRAADGDIDFQPNGCEIRP